MPYLQFLQAKSFERSLRVGMKESAQAVIGNAAELSALGFEISRESRERSTVEITAEISTLRETISGGLSEVGAAVRENTEVIYSTLNWGFSQLLLELGQTNASLRELIQIAKTPSQTWAYEQFEIARDEFRRQLFPEALRSLRRAIDGYGGNPGYVSDFRFHFLLGTISLGDFRNNDGAIVDPGLAETSFLDAARYAQADFPDEEGKCLTCAARAAFILGNLARAEGHAKSALSAFRPYGGTVLVPAIDDMGPNHASCLYLLARIQAAGGHARDAEKYLSRALKIDPRLSVALFSDPEFLSPENSQVAQTAFENANAFWRRMVLRAIEGMEDAITYVYEMSILGIDPPSLVLNEHTSVVEISKSIRSTDTLLGNHGSFLRLMSARPLAQSLPSLVRNRAEGRFKHDIEQTRSAASGDEPWSDNAKAAPAIGLGLGILAAIFTGIGNGVGIFILATVLSYVGIISIEAFERSDKRRHFKDQHTQWRRGLENATSSRDREVWPAARKFSTGENLRP